MCNRETHTITNLKMVTAGRSIKGRKVVNIVGDMMSGLGIKNPGRRCVRLMVGKDNICLTWSRRARRWSWRISEPANLGNMTLTITKLTNRFRFSNSRIEGRRPGTGGRGREERFRDAKGRWNRLGRLK